MQQGQAQQSQAQLYRMLIDRTSAASLHWSSTLVTQIVHHYTADSIAVSAKAPFTKQCMHALFSMCQNSWSANWAAVVTFEMVHEGGAVYTMQKMLPSSCSCHFCNIFNGILHLFTRISWHISWNRLCVCTSAAYFCKKIIIQENLNINVHK